MANDLRTSKMRATPLSENCRSMPQVSQCRLTATPWCLIQIQDEQATVVLGYTFNANTNSTSSSMRDTIELFHINSPFSKSPLIQARCIISLHDNSSIILDINQTFFEGGRSVDITMSHKASSNSHIKKSCLNVAHLTCPLHFIWSSVGDRP